jgi:hypothetical protein
MIVTRLPEEGKTKGGLVILSSHPRTIEIRTNPHPVDS